MNSPSYSNEMEEWARRLARLNSEADSNITFIYWFPDDTELRLLEVDKELTSQDEHVIPFRFDPLPQEGIKAPISIALVSETEFKAQTLPKSWGVWTNGKKLLP